MTQFKAGDRVRYVHDGYEGTVHGEVEGTSIDVMWDDDGMVEVHVGDLELVEEQPDRAYYEPTLTGGYPEETKTENFFESAVHRILNGVAETVVQKNVSYGDSALNPIRVFSKADRMEQLFVRLDDKLSRVQRGTEYPGDDTLRDIIGYCTLVLIARESE